MKNKKIAIAISILAMVASVVSMVCSVDVWTMKRREQEERISQRDLASLKMITKEE